MEDMGNLPSFPSRPMSAIAELGAILGQANREIRDFASARPKLSRIYRPHVQILDRSKMEMDRDAVLPLHEKIGRIRVVPLAAPVAGSHGNPLLDRRVRAIQGDKI